MKTTKLRLRGLTCDACVKLSRMKIGKIAGVKDILFSSVDDKVDIIADREIAASEIKEALAGTDYKVII
ncbi:MAG: heavy metal-associated domain-containing protein [Parcubacteria group bacterium]|jgi:copper chaperone CopZ